MIQRGEQLFHRFIVITNLDRDRALSCCRQPFGRLEILLDVLARIETNESGGSEDCGVNLFGNATVCAPYARCDGGVCRELAHLGETCTANPTCYSNSCVNGGCVRSNSCND